MKICIVDDDKLVALSLKTILEANADIQVCGLGENGKDAIDLFHQYQPDVLLMDIRMSEMTGLEAAEQLLVEDSSRKILLLTTFSDDEYIIKALNLGVKGYILKQNFEKYRPCSFCCPQWADRLWRCHYDKTAGTFAQSGFPLFFP